jgi:hypothetical protein
LLCRGIRFPLLKRVLAALNIETTLRTFMLGQSLERACLSVLTREAKRMAMRANDAKSLSLKHIYVLYGNFERFRSEARPHFMSRSTKKARELERALYVIFDKH